MRLALALLLGLAVVFAFTGMSVAEDKEVTLKGTICCPKCELKEAKECANCIKVKEGGKEVVYYFMDEGKKETYHKTICSKPKEGSVKGVVSEKEGKKYIKPTKDSVKFD